jgi:hypothetical protein
MLVLLIELPAEVFHENSHHAFVGVRHGEADPNATKLIDGSDHAYPWLELLSFY